MHLTSAGEPFVALENLCEQLFEYDVNVPAAIVERIEVLADLWAWVVVFAPVGDYKLHPAKDVELTISPKPFARNDRDVGFQSNVAIVASGIS